MEETMSMEIETRQGEQLARYLNLATSEIKLTAANMANIDTPGYRAVGLDFEAEMRESLKDLDEGDQNPRPVRVRAVDGLISRPDGNDVSMDREGLNLAEAQLKFKVGVTLLRSEHQLLMDAIHADNKYREGATALRQPGGSNAIRRRGVEGAPFVREGWMNLFGLMETSGSAMQ